MAELRASETVTRVLGAVSAVLAVALAVLLALDRGGPDEDLEDLLLFVLFAPLVCLLCLATLAALVVALVRTGGRVRLLTWLLALPAAAAGALLLSGTRLDLS